MKERPQPQDRINREKRRDALGRIVRGGTSSTSPHPQDRSGCSTKEDAKEEQRHRVEDEAEGMQCSKDEAGKKGRGSRPE